jgi:hypothetical protein
MSRQLPYLFTVVAYFKERLRKTTKKLIPDRRSPDRNLNPGPSEYEVRVLTTRLPLSFFQFLPSLLIITYLIRR